MWESRRAGLPQTSRHLPDPGATQISIKVNNSAGSSSTMALVYRQSYIADPLASIPPGVTLRQIDGGLTYYASNGFTFAADASFNGLSWDDPQFFPVTFFYAFFYSGPTDVTSFFAEGFNTSHNVTSPTNIATLAAAGVWIIEGVPGGTPENGTPNSAVVGFHDDEPSALSDIQTMFTGVGANITGRFAHVAATHNQIKINGDIGGTHMPAVVTTQFTSSAGNRPVNIWAADIFWFAASATTFWQTNGGQSTYGLGSAATADQMARGSNYGDMVDIMRSSWGVTAPIGGPYIEITNGLVTDAGNRNINPPEMNWAAWSVIVHGGRFLNYFTRDSSVTPNNNGVPTAIYSGQSISIHDQLVATNGQIKNLARIISAQFALSYASVSPAGYTFPTLHLVLDNGIEIMTKYYTGGSFTNSLGTFPNGFYIFSTVRGSATQTNIMATFTINDSHADSVNVIGESRVIIISGGQFTDTFATAYTSHIYQVVRA